MSIKRKFSLLVFSLLVFSWPLAGIKAAPEPPFDLLGWGWFGNPQDDYTGQGVYGFVSLSCENEPLDCLQGQYQVSVENSGLVQGYAWLGDADLGWLNFSPGGAGVVYDSATGKLSGQGRIEGMSSLGAEAGWVQFRAADDSWGVTVDDDGEGNYFLRGLAWAGGGNEGLGWINFGLETWEEVSGEPWVGTEGGDVYVGGQINTQADLEDYGKYNASYLVLADGTITNFNTELGEEGIEESAGKNYQMADYLDVEEITLDEDGDGYNKHGQVIDTVTLSIAAPGDIILGGRIFYISTDYNLEDYFIFNNALGDDDGSGTIVVEGDLTISDDLYYDESSISEIYNLASVAWVVKGDLYIDPEVRQIVGAFFVQGQIYTGESTYPLEVQGLMVAQGFNLQRTHTGSQAGAKVEAAEKFIYDGRLIANPSPGLEDFFQAMPWFSQVAPD